MMDGGVRFTPRLALGLAVIGLGIVLFMVNLGLWHAETAFQTWLSGVLVAFGLFSWRNSRATGGILMALGTWSMISLLTGYSLDGEVLVPLFLVFFGGRLVWKAVVGGGFAGDPHEADSTFHTVAFWSGIDRKISSQNFASGEAVAVMGGCTVDLRSSFIATGVAEIFVFTMWGGVEILVPDDWAVTCRGVAIMGGFDDATEPPRGGSQQRLVVTGVALMGAAEIRNRKESEA